MNTQSILDSLRGEWEHKSKKLGVSLNYDDQTNLAILRAAIEHFGEGAVKAKLQPLATGFWWRKPQNQRAQAYWAELWPDETPPGLNGLPKVAQPIKTVPTYQPKASQDLMAKLQKQFT